MLSSLLGLGLTPTPHPLSPQRLAAYFHGGNADGVSMPLTLPLLVSHRPRGHPAPWQARSYKVALFLSHEFQVGGISGWCQQILQAKVIQHSDSAQ